MSVNFFLQNGIPESFSATQNLVEDLIIQSIQMSGMDTYYIPRTLVNPDLILTEDAMASYEDAYRLEMYLDNVMGFDGDGAMLGKFGIEVHDSCTFVVARRRWEAEVGRTNKTRLPRPVEGDIVYLPMTKSFFEIKKVQNDNPFYQLGKLFVYKLECELFQFNQEHFNTGVPEIDSLIQSFDLSDSGRQIMTESGDALTAEDGYQIIQEFSTDEIDGAAQNDEFKLNDDVFDFSEHNPFAEIDH